VTYRGERYKTLLDTGCDRSIVGSRSLPDLPYRQIEMTVTAANQSPVPVLGTAVVEFAIDGVTMSQEFLVSDVIDEIILGSDWLTANGCVWDFQNGRLQIPSASPHWITLCRIDCGDCVRRLYAAETVEIPPLSQADLPVRSVWSTLPPKADWVVEPVQVSTDVVIARTLIAADPRSAMIRVLNYGPTSWTVSSGDLMGHAESVEPAVVPAAIPAAIPAVVPAAIPADQHEHIQCLLDALPDELTAVERQAAVTFIQSYAHVFSKSKTDLERNRQVLHCINTGDHPPVRQQLSRQPYAHEAEIERNVQQLLAAKVIEPAQSAYNSNVLLVKKKDGSLRFCVDYRRLNSCTIKDSYPLPRIDSCLDSLGGSRYFSTLDLRSGYWQSEIAEEDRDKTAFSTKSGQYRFVVLSMGLANAPSQFQRLMDLVLAGLNFEACLVYLDDIICFSETFEQHLQRLGAIFERLVAANLLLSASKCNLFQPKVHFLGHVVGRSGIAADASKIDAVLNWPPPKNIHEVRSYLGLTGYYR
jgi:predicted aspartyl protease